MGAAVDIKEEILKLERERDSIYRSVQDFKVSANVTDQAIKSMGELSRKIENMKKKLKQTELKEGSAEFARRKQDFLTQ